MLARTKPKCIKCGGEIYGKYDVPTDLTFIGDTFQGWDYEGHKCIMEEQEEIPKQEQNEFVDKLASLIVGKGIDAFEFAMGFKACYEWKKKENAELRAEIERLKDENKALRKMIYDHAPIQFPA